MFHILGPAMVKLRSANFVDTALTKVPADLHTTMENGWAPGSPGLFRLVGNILHLIIIFS